MNVNALTHRVLQDLKRRASIGDNWTLTIKSAAMGDLGEYSCVVTGENGDQQSASAYLNVQCKCIHAKYFPCERGRGRSNVWRYRWAK